MVFKRNSITANNKIKLNEHGTTIKSNCRNVKHKARLFANSILASISGKLKKLLYVCQNKTRGFLLGFWHKLYKFRQFVFYS